MKIENNISGTELATIRIALSDKIDKINEAIKIAEEINNETGHVFWKELLERHTTLLNKLYNMQTY
jgi:hypothetical protein